MADENDKVSEFLEKEKEKLLEMLFLSVEKRPQDINLPPNRMMIPKFFNSQIKQLYKKDISIVEDDGKSHDWELFTKKISVKSTQYDIFQTYNKKNLKKKNKLKPIQLKNSKSNITLSDNEFDYLLIMSTNINNYGFYLLTINQVKDLLKNSKQYHFKYDENGYDGAGQVHLYIPSKTECIFYIELNTENLSKLRQKYPNTISFSKRNKIWNKDIDKCVSKQILL
jgi:hypothetical protein